LIEAVGGLRKPKRGVWSSARGTNKRNREKRGCLGNERPLQTWETRALWKRQHSLERKRSVCRVD
jgi:hypothetical protein